MSSDTGETVPSTTVTVACCQLPLNIDSQQKNQKHIESALREAKSAGSSVAVLPELANTGYMFSDQDELRSFAEPTDGPTINHWEHLANKLDLIVIGGFAEEDSSGRVYNSAALIDHTGLKAVYRKAHLWDREKENLFEAGEGFPPVVPTKLGRIAVMICYDLEFPEWGRHVALQDADLLCAPVNWPLYPRPAVERPTELVRVQAEASRNRLAVACADRVGTERGQNWLGASAIIAADGYPVASAEIGEESIVVADLDLVESRNKWISDRNHVHTDRRVDLYERNAGRR